MHDAAIRDLRLLVQDVVGACAVLLSEAATEFDAIFPASPVWVAAETAAVREPLAQTIKEFIALGLDRGSVSARVDRDALSAHLVIAHYQPNPARPIHSRAAPDDYGARPLAELEHIVKKHGGHVSLTRGSTPGQEMLITLPLIDAPLAAGPAFASDLRSTSESIAARLSGTQQSTAAAIEATDVALLIADDASRLAAANTAALVLTGYAPAEVNGLRVSDILALRGSQATSHWYAFAADQRQEGILMLRRKDGRRVPIRYSALWSVRPGQHLSAIAPIG